LRISRVPEQGNFYYSLDWESGGVRLKHRSGGVVLSKSFDEGGLGLREVSVASVALPLQMPREPLNPKLDFTINTQLWAHSREV
jgi:hypothetical protein